MPISDLMKSLHSWKVTPEQAIRIQEDLRDRIILKKTFSVVKTVGGADVSYEKEGELLYGAVVILSFPKMELIESATARGRISFPYIPGLLAFREGPVLIRAFRRLGFRPDLLIVDGQGIAHPRGFGLACHLGLWLDLPSIGCAKTPLLGGPLVLGISRGSFQFVERQGRKVGVVLRTQKGIRPVFVSPGHRIDLPTSIRLVLESCRGFRIPEPLRQAHQLSRSLMQKA